MMRTLCMLALACLGSHFLWGQETYYYNPVTAQTYDSTTYEQLKQKRTTNLQRIKKKVVLNENLKLAFLSADSIVYTYKWEFFIGPFANMSMLYSKRQDHMLEDMLKSAFPLGEVQTIDGKALTLDSLKGKPTMINFWFTTCAPCLAEIPALNHIQAQYAEQVNFITIIPEKQPRVEAFLAENPFHFEHICVTQGYTRELGINYYPITLFLDKKGRVVNIEGGIQPIQAANGQTIPGDGQEFRDIIESLL